MIRRLAGTPTAAVAGGLMGSAVLIAVITLLARVAGFGRWLVFSGTVHSGCTGTAYATANVLPNVLFEIAAGGALAGVVVPVVVAAAETGRTADVDRIVSALLTWCLLGLVPLALLLAVVADPATGLLLGRKATCSGEVALASRMLLVFAPQVPLYGVGVVLMGVLQAYRRFVWPALAPLLSTAVMVCCYLGYATVAGAARNDRSYLPTSAAEGILAWGTTAGVVALSLPLLWPVRRLGIRLRPRLRFPAGVGAKVRSLATAGMGTLIAQQLAVLVTLVLAGRLGERGTWPVLQYAQAFYLLPYAVLVVPVATAVFSEISRQAAVGDAAGFARTASRSTRTVVVVACLGVGALVALAPTATALIGVLEGGNGGPVPVLSLALATQAPGLLGWALIAHVGRILYAAGRGREAASATVRGWGGVVACSAGVALAMVAAGTDGTRATVLGVGVGNTVGMSLAGWLLLRALRRDAGTAAIAGVSRAFWVGAVGAGLVAGAGRWVVDRVLADLTGVTGVLLAGVLGSVCVVALFGAVLMVLARTETTELLGRMRRGPR